MELHDEEIKGGWTWFFVAGAFAIALSFSLYFIDNMLTFSDKEERLGKTLKSLRTAQHQVADPINDARLVAVPVRKAQGTHSVRSTEEHSEHDNH